MSSVVDRDLFERDDELEIARRVLARALEDGGACLAVEGDPGVGKTTLLEAVAAEARARGYEVLRARGVELETVLGYGVVRQLLDRRAGADVLAEAPAPARRVLEPTPEPGDAGDDPFAALYGLYSICGSLAEGAPLLLVVDDAQWADEASMRFVAFLRERLDGLPVVVAIGLRTPARGEHEALHARIAADPRTVRLELAPLGAEAAARLLRAELPDATDALCAACHEATGGNPFYLRSLTRELAAGGGVRAGADVAELAPAAVRRAVLARVGRLGPDAVAVANAVAILGGDAEVRLVAKLAELELERVVVVADALAEAGVLSGERPLAFVHPIVRGTVVADLPTGVQALARARAARILIEEGAPATRIALQLLATEPAEQAWVVDALLEGAAAASGTGGRSTAVAMLRRALAEPPPRERRAEVLAALGIAERHVMAPEAGDRLEAALAETEDEETRLALIVELATAREQQGAMGDALALLRQALERADADLAAGGGAGEGATDAKVARAALLEAQLAAGRLVALLPAPAAEFARGRARLEGLEPRSLEARLLASVLAFDTLARGETVARARELVELALAVPPEPAALETLLPMVAMVTATAAGVPELVVRAVDVGAAARATGSRWTASAAATWRALAAHHAGRLDDAEADASGAVEGFADLPVGLAAAVGVLAEIQLDRHGPVAAAELFARTRENVTPAPVIQRVFLLMAQARVALAANRHEQALAAARAAGELMTPAGLELPALLPWRLAAARALLAAGETEQARALADEQLRVARAGGEPGAIAEALTVRGLAGGAEAADAALALLGEAVAAAQASGRPLARARALVALGAALRRGGQVTEARAPLSEALALARDCGARALADGVREELAAAGVRTRRPPREQARWELTPSELRVVRLAADGLTNREIAQTLFSGSRRSRRTCAPRFASSTSDRAASWRSRSPTALGSPPPSVQGAPLRAPAPRGGSIGRCTNCRCASPSRSPAPTSRRPAC